jgi:hypothetical protein
MGRNRLKFVLITVMVLVALQSKGDTQGQVKPVPHENTHKGALQAEAFPGAMQILTPYVMVREEKLLEGDEVEVIEEDYPEAPTLVLYLGEFDAWIEALSSDRIRLTFGELNDGLAHHMKVTHKAGALPEEVSERLERFFKVIGSKGLSEAEYTWLVTEVSLQLVLADRKY